MNRWRKKSIPTGRWVKILALVSVLSGGWGAGPASADPAGKDELVVADFSQAEAGTFPEGWKSVWAWNGKGPEVYTVVKEGECSYLKADADNSDVLVAKEFEYNVKVYPFLRWRWQAVELPAGADERKKETGDSGAAVYVVFPGRFRPENIKYVWSSSLPEGTTTESPYNSKTKIVVLRNRSTPLGKWVSEEVNVYQDYKRLFGGEPEKVQAIAVMSDSNNTESRAEAHYDDIRIGKQSTIEEKEPRGTREDESRPDEQQAE